MASNITTVTHGKNYKTSFSSKQKAAERSAQTYCGVISENRARYTFRSGFTAETDTSLAKQQVTLNKTSNLQNLRLPVTENMISSEVQIINKQNAQFLFPFRTHNSQQQMPQRFLQMQVVRADALLDAQNNCIKALKKILSK